MKIWYQSYSRYGYEAVWDEYGRTLEEKCRRILRPDVQIHVIGMPVMIRDIENWKALQYYQNVQVMNNMLKAEKEGYDAFVIGCTLDTGLAEGKSLLNIPVVGISEAAFHIAMTMGRLFAVVSSSPAFPEVWGELVVRYGVNSRYLSGPYMLNASEEEIASTLTQPQALIEKFKSAAERAVADGASVIIPAPAFLTTLAHRAGLTQIQGALVLDTVSVAVKTAEMLVDLKKIGIEPCRRIGVYCRPNEEFRKEALSRLRPVFKIE